MPSTYGKSTYQQLIDDALFDINEETRLASLSPESVQGWILEAHRQICDRSEVREQYSLSVKSGQADYLFQDNAPITAVTGDTVSPIVVTSTSHGVSNGELVRVEEVYGNDAANGVFMAKSVATNTFALHNYAEIISARLDSTDPTKSVITTKDAYGFANGSTVSISGNSSVTDGDYVIEVVDALNFKIVFVALAAPTTGGFATQPSTGSGAYISGGMFWKSTELPTYFKTFIEGERTWSNLKLTMRIMDLQELTQLDRQNSKRYVAFTQYDSPMGMAIWEKMGKRYLRIYPVPFEDETITLFGAVKLNPRVLQGASLDSYVRLHQTYDEATIRYIKFKTFNWLSSDDVKGKEFYQKAQQEFQLFENEIKNLSRAFPRRVVQQITYT